MPPPSAVPPRSGDTLDSLLSALAGDSLTFDRLSLWLIDASLEEVAAFWDGYRQSGKMTNDFTDVVFIRWSSKDPQAAIAAVAGTPNEHYAWWAWACHDPESALAAAMAASPDRVNNVAWGIGEFHAAWLRKNFDLIPESARGNALQGLAKWDDGEEPLLNLEFLKEKGYGFHPGIFGVLVRKDPWAAMDWMEKNRSEVGDPFGPARATADQFVSLLSEHHPDVLQRMSEVAKDPALRQALEKASFASLVKNDPAAAAEQAMAVEASRVAVPRLATAGKAILESDPQMAFDLAGKMFQAKGNPFFIGTEIHLGNGSWSSFGGEDESVRTFVRDLLKADPGRLVQLAADAQAGQAVDAETAMRTRSRVMWEWSQLDTASLEDWLPDAPHDAWQVSAREALIQRFREAGRHEDAMRTIVGSQDINRFFGYDAFRQWVRQSPEEAESWLNSAELPAEIRNTLGNAIRSE